MTPLYRMPLALPSLIAALWLSGCDSPAPPAREQAERPGNRYVEALQEAEAARHGAERRNQQEQRIDALLGRDAAPSVRP